MDTAIFKEISQWAEESPRIESVLLVGSWARGENRASSDIDLVVLTDAKEELLRDQSWTARFGRVARQQTESYGACTSVRVWYQDGREVEFGLVLPSWADAPLDGGTARVLRDGYRVLADKKGRFARLAIPRAARRPQRSKRYARTAKQSGFAMTALPRICLPSSCSACSARQAGRTARKRRKCAGRSTRRFAAPRWSSPRGTGSVWSGPCGC